MIPHAYSYRTARLEKINRRTAWVGELTRLALSAAKSYCCCTVSGLCLISILSLTPSLFMKYSIEQNGIQMLSDRELPENASEIIGRARERIAASELYRPDMTFKVYLCSNHWLYLLANPFGINSKGVHIMTTGRIMIDWESIRGKYDLVHSISHEITHDIVQDHIGWRVFTMPKWVSEGYAEYVARCDWPSRDVRKKLLQLRSGNPDFNDYGHNWLLVSYSLDVRKISLDDLLRRPPATRQLTVALQSRSMDWLLDNIVVNHDECFRHIKPHNNRKPVTGILICCHGYWA